MPDIMKTILIPNNDDKLQCFGKFNNSVMGFMKDIQYEKGEFTLNKGETIILYTDGVTDAFDPDGKHFGEKRFEDLINTNRLLSVDDICLNTIKEVRAFENNERFDDTTILAFRRE